MREQFRDATDRMGGDPRQHVLEPGEWLYASPLAGSHEAAQHCRGVAALVAAKEGPIAAAHCDAADRPFGCLILDLQVPVFTVAGQRRQFFSVYRTAQPSGLFGRPSTWISSNLNSHATYPE